MKLLFCKNCADLFALRKEMRRCACGMAWGRYIDDVNAEYHGTMAIPVGIRQSGFEHAIRNQPESGMGLDFPAFVVPKCCPTMKRKPWSTPANQD